jgi:hypothetical protein
MDLKSIRAIVTTLFRVELVSVESTRSGTAHQTISYTTPAAEQTADESTRTGTDPHIDHVPMTPIETRTALSYIPT